MEWGKTGVAVTTAGFDNWESGQPNPSPLDFAYINGRAGAVGKWFTTGEPDASGSIGALTGIMCRPAS